MADSRRQLGTFAVLALVLLRVAIGWHFFCQGTEKLGNDPVKGGYYVNFSAGPFLNQAKGPLAPWYHAYVPDVHDSETLLAVPRQNTPSTAEELDNQAQWVADYMQRRSAAKKINELPPIEFPSFAPYANWARQIAKDWEATLTSVVATPDLTEDQRRQAAEAFALRKQQLADYLAEESDAITEYQHELWRLENWRAMPEAGDVPFQKQRIATKAAETTAKAKAWTTQVAEFDSGYLDDLRNVLTPIQLQNKFVTAAVDRAVADREQTTLRQVNLAVTALTLGVGICLLLGFFTRLAAFVGGIFLLSVIASQPPWLATAVPTYEQIVELAGMLVLFTTAAGRWLGLDYFTYALFRRMR